MSTSPPSSSTNTSPCSNGLIVPGSTFRYPSHFIVITFLLFESSFPIDAVVIPFPSPDITPPVMNIHLESMCIS